LIGVATGQVGATDAAGEERVAGDKKISGGNVEAEAAFGVSRGVDDGSFDAVDGDGFSIDRGMVGWVDLGDFEAEPTGLGVNHGDEWQVFFAVEDGCAGELLEGERAGDVIDMGVCHDNTPDGEFVLIECGEDAGNVVTGIDDDGVARGFVAKNGAVATEKTDGEGFADHGGFWRVLFIEREKRRPKPAL